VHVFDFGFLFFLQISKDLHHIFGFVEFVHPSLSLFVTHHLSFELSIFLQQFRIVHAHLVHVFSLGLVVLGRYGVYLIAGTEIIVIVFLGKRIASLVENHRLVLLLLKKFKEFDFLVHLPQSVFQTLVFRLEFP
jgi:hypothetical protein